MDNTSTGYSVKPAKRVLDLPRVTAEILWIHGYYDGPLSGMVMYEGRMCWFSTPDDPGLPKRRYFLYELEDWELVRLVTRHIQFEMYVGTHHCRHVFGNDRGPIKPMELHKKFYEDYPPDYWNPAQGKRPIAKFVRETRNK